MTDRISEIRARCEVFKNSDDTYKHVRPEYILSVLADDGYPHNWAKIAAHSHTDIPYLLDQLAERDKELKDLQKEVASLAIESIEREKTLARLEAEVMVWAKAEREWRLVVLPCKVGTRVWVIGQNCDLCRDMYAEEPCLFGSCEYKEVFESVFGYGMIDNFGKTVFLTPAEAEAALEGRE